jgi:Acyltransferase
MAEPADLDVPWTRSRPASRVRELLICGALGPLMDLYTRRRLIGRERLDQLTGPVVFVANHNSHMDTPVILRALPGWWRRRTAVAAATDYLPGAGERPSHVMERVRLFLAECGAETERPAETQRAPA